MHCQCQKESTWDDLTLNLQVLLFFIHNFWLFSLTSGCPSRFIEYHMNRVHLHCKIDIYSCFFSFVLIHLCTCSYFFCWRSSCWWLLIEDLTQDEWDSCLVSWWKDDRYFTCDWFLGWRYVSLLTFFHLMFRTSGSLYSILIFVFDLLYF